MKKIFLLQIFITISFICSAQTPHYEINANIQAAEGVTFILQKSIDGKIINLDTGKIVNGSFKITGGSVSYPEMVFLTAPDRKKRFSFYLENSKISVKGHIDSLDNVIITGSKTQDELTTLTASLKSQKDHLQRLTDEYRSASAEIMKTTKSIVKDFVINNPGSFATPSLLRDLANEMSVDEIEKIIDAMDPSVANTTIVTEIKAKNMARRRVQVGQEAPDFTLNDVNGNPVTLSLKIKSSKLLLIDFWAGWCGPCRLENPNVVKVYNEFKNKGFDILGVSLDRTRTEWTKAIADDRLSWTHVSDLKYFNSPVAKMYSIASIPANFLLDQNGIIISRNLRGEDLYNAIKEQLSK